MHSIVLSRSLQPSGRSAEPQSIFLRLLSSRDQKVEDCFNQQSDEWLLELVVCGPGGPRPI